MWSPLASTWTARPFRPIYPTILVRFSRTRRGLTRSADVTTGEFRATSFGSLEAAFSECRRLGVRELVVAGEMDDSVRERAEKSSILLSCISPEEFQSNGIEGLDELPAEGPSNAAECLVSYLGRVHPKVLPTLAPIEFICPTVE